jgi:hypothetical protein
MLQFIVDSLHALHVLGTAQTTLADKGVFEMHAVDGVDTD